MAATVVKLLDAVAATGASSAAAMQRHSQNNPTNVGVVQIDISGTATVALEGRMDANATWITILTYTATAAQKITPMPLMRANVTSYTSGTVSAWLSL